MVHKADIEDVYPLSPLQEGILFHALLDPEAGDYVVQLSAKLAPWITTEVFRTAWEVLIARHGVLRTAFVRNVQERPLQVVVKGAQLPWTELDWRGVTAEERKRRLQVMLAVDRRRGFVLSEPPLLRVSAIRFTESEWGVVLSFHHILWDGWSLNQLLQELSWCCEAVSHGRIPELPFRRPFRDYIQWLDQQDMQDAEAFWRTELEAVGRTSLPGAGRVAPTGLRPTYGQLAVQLSPGVNAALVDFGRRHKLTLNTLVQGALAILLARYTSSADVVFGATVSGRPVDLVGADSILGFFINTLPVRVRVAEETILEDWLTELQQRQLRAREYDFCQLADIQRGTFGAGGIPLFECILDFKAFHTRQDPDRIDRPLFAGQVATFEQSGYPLTITVSPQPELLIEVDFSHMSFAPDAISRMLSHFQTLLENIPRCTGRRVADVELIGVGEQRTIESWSTRSVRTKRATGFQEDFELQVTAQPAATAVITGHERCSYDTLNRRANQLSRYLQGLGLGSEARIGVCLERSLDLVVALVATLKSGAVYVPLDPSYPKERLDRYACDSGLDALIVTPGTTQAAPESSALRICLDSDRSLIETHSDANPSLRMTPARSLAYIMYTSGSTGVPKGAMVETLGMLNHIDAMVDFMTIRPSDVVAETASICFDISVWQMLAPLVAGASIRIFEGDSAFDPAALLRGVKQEGVTILQVVPALLQLVLEEAESNRQRLGGALRSLVVTGEAVPFELASRWLERHPDVPLLNAYGPAECADDVTLGVLTLSDLRQSTSVSIGRPIANSEVYVLDARMRLAPIGVVGELYVGGDGVGRGYASDPARTAAAFIPHPFAERPGDRLYRTGDLARWSEYGTLHFVGRRDAQIKFNGARIETSEIESVLQGHEVVERAVVACDGHGETRQLVAFVVASKHIGPARADFVSRLMDHLRAQLPRYMMPGVVTLVDSVPLTASGKLDRDRLLRESNHVPENRQRVHALTAAEEVMAAIWSVVLETDRIAADDDFFELGGHSLLAMQLVSRATRIFDCSIPLSALFDTSRLADFTAVVEAARRDPEAVSVPLERVARNRPLPVSSVQQRMWTVLVSSPRTALFSMPMAIRLTGSLNRTALAVAFSDVIKRHETLRTSIRTHDGRLAQFIAVAPSSFNLPVVDLAQYGVDVEMLAREVALEEAHRSFNPVDDHGIRGALLKLNDEDHVLLITVSHLFADDASLAILLADLGRAYEARAAGLPSPLSPLPIQFVDHVCWIERWQEGAEAVRQQNYWSRQLREPWRRLELPTSRPRSGVLSSRFRRVRHRLSQEAFRQLHQMARAQCVTLFTAVLTAFKTFLFGKTGELDIWVATMVSTRHGSELHEVVGPLLNTQILRTNLSGAARFCDLLARVQRIVIEAIANCDLPLERVVTGLSAGSADLIKRLPIQTLVLFQQTFDDVLAMGDLQASPLSMPVAVGDEMEPTSYELICEVEAHRDTLDIVFRYNADLFEDGLAQEMVVEFASVLASAAANPQQNLASLSGFARDGI